MSLTKRPDPNAKAPTIYSADTAMRRQLVASLRLQQLSPEQIVEQLATVDCINPRTGNPWSVETIREDLKALNIDWQRLSRVATQEHIAETLAKLREVERAAWQKGDLDSVLKAIDKEMKLLGLSATQTLSITIDDRAAELAALIGTDKEKLKQVAEALARGEAP